MRRKYNARLNSINAVAEAYPEADDEPQQSEPESDVSAQSDFEFGNDTPVGDAPAPPQEVAQDVAVSGVAEPSRDPTVELHHDDEDDYQAPRRPSSRDGGTNTYFPITFGSTNGGAIAIANAFSNGKGGSAASRATAYGSPAKKRTQQLRE